MNNNTCIIYAVEGNRLLMYICRVSDNTCSPPNEYSTESWHLSEFVSDSCVSSARLPGAPTVLHGASIWSQTNHNHSHGTSVPVIRDPSYTHCWRECPPMVWYSPAIDASKFTLHILANTPGGSQWLKHILLMDISLIYICSSLWVGNSQCLLGINTVLEWKSVFSSVAVLHYSWQNIQSECIK